MANTLVICNYGNAELGATCCYVTDGEAQSMARCPVFDRGECPFGRKVEGCGTCAHCGDMTFVDEERMVACDVNEFQMYAPYATECKHWEKALDED